MKTGSHAPPTQTSGCAPQTLSSRPEHSLPRAEGNAEWRDPVSRADYTRRRIAMIVLVAGVLLSIKAKGRFAETLNPTHPKLTCTPAPCVLPPTQASEGGNIVTDSPIVTNPLNENQLLLGSFDGNCPGLGFHLSRDGGSTWTVANCMPDIYTKQHVYQPEFDPLVGYDRHGNAYAAGEYFDTGRYGYGFVAVQESTDGTHWSKPVVALREQGHAFAADTWLTVDTNPGSPYVDSVYASGVMVVGSRQAKNQVLVSHSTDGGKTWAQSALDSVQTYPEEDTFTRMAVGSDGTVYVTWLHCRGKKGGDGSGLCPTVHMMFSKSSDGGGTWTPPQRMATVKMPHYWWLPNTQPGIGVDNYPVIVADNSSGQYAGNLYVAMYTWTGTYLRVQVIRSTDGGNTWSTPVPLAPKTDTHDQFFPAISVSSTGVVGVSWLDRRNDPNNVNYQAFAAFSDDGGQSFQRNWQLTQAFSNPDTNGAYNWMGDYTTPLRDPTSSPPGWTAATASTCKR